ncbi:hypothetical protein, partial [uncultured Ruegeria sp.]|uniref:hypothetical protein n=1 Tax=uncultured Ruegeria sp. TaxID=259304 RepID=UPI0026358ABB
ERLTICSIFALTDTRLAPLSRKAAIFRKMSKGNYVPQTVSSSNLRFRACSEWQQSGLRPQHLGWLLDVGYGPLFYSAVAV